MPTPDADSPAGRLIAATGSRVTRPRVAALTTLMEAGRTLSHAQVQERLPDLDRVSLYRALDWLTEQRLVHRMTDPDGIRRYGSDGSAEDHQHAHFHCTRCGRTACLPKIRPPAVVLPKGYRQQRIEIQVSGLCQPCASAGLM